MRSNMTGRKRVAASVAATALLAGGMALAAPGAASASPALGSADAAIGAVNDLGLWPVQVSEGVDGPAVTVKPNAAGTVSLKMERSVEGAVGPCLLALVPALDTPLDGLATGEVRETAVDSLILPKKDGSVEKTTEVLDPGLYAVVSHCSKPIVEGEDRVWTASQPQFFATLGTLGEMS